MHPAPRLRLFTPHSPLFLLPLLASLAAAPPASGDTCTYTMRKDVPAAMRDGVILRSNVFTPNEPGSYPIILLRLP